MHGTHAQALNSPAQNAPKRSLLASHTLSCLTQEPERFADKTTLEQLCELYQWEKCGSEGGLALARMLNTFHAGKKGMA